MNAVNYVHAEDPDLKWLRDQVELLDETIRQTLLDGRSRQSNAVKVLTTLRDRCERLARRLDPSTSITVTGP